MRETTDSLPPRRIHMKTALKAGASVLVLLTLVAVGTYVWATMRSSSLRSRTIETHAVDFPIPFPLLPSERAALASEQDAAAVALDRAVERGRHLVEARYACTECHGQDFGGGVMVDDPMLGTLLGPNLTTGSGSRTLAYTPADWDRAVRHGVLRDRRPSVMPAEDFRQMSDQELSDIVAYIRSLPPVEGDVADVRLGPLGKVLVALGQLRFSADFIAPSGVHPATPPASEVSVEFGAHLAGVCTGCHQADLAGGPIPGGDPSWPPARNITSHVDGLAGWTYDDFRRVLLEARRPDGTEVREPMSLMTSYAANMTDVEMAALWAYLQSVTPTPSRE